MFVEEVLVKLERTLWLLRQQTWREKFSSSRRPPSGIFQRIESRLTAWSESCTFEGLPRRRQLFQLDLHLCSSCTLFNVIDPPSASTMP